MADGNGAARRSPDPAPVSGSPANCPACGAALRVVSGWAPGSIDARTALPPPITAARQRAGTLSPREKLTFQLLGRGYDNRTIARELMISERTAKRHVTAILTKLKLESRLQAGITALITPALPAAATAPAGGGNHPAHWPPG
jgi:DNA-binding NarL/FixJ family response regulator